METEDFRGGFLPLDYYYACAMYTLEVAENSKSITFGDIQPTSAISESLKNDLGWYTDHPQKEYILKQISFQDIYDSHCFNRERIVSTTESSKPFWFAHGSKEYGTTYLFLYPNEKILYSMRKRV